MIINLDENLENADWTKKNSWDLPYKSEEELKAGLGDSYEHFKGLPAYQARPWANKKSAKDAAAELLKRL